MKEKKIVKVMNFHSLIRVDSSRRQAMKYMRLEQEISEIIDMIVNNRNFILDKTIFKVKQDAPPLNIYFGSDYGFCGSINFTINRMIEEDTEGDQIIIGRKLRNGSREPLLHISREDYKNSLKELYRILEGVVRDNSHSSVTIHYYQFNNISSIEAVQKKIYPYDLQRHGAENYRDDYFVEGDMNVILRNLITNFLEYELRIAEVSSFASENVLRQNSTTESLKKIEEMEEEEFLEQRKEKTEKGFKKVIDSYMKKTFKRR